MKSLMLTRLLAVSLLVLIFAGFELRANLS